MDLPHLMYNHKYFCNFVIQNEQINIQADLYDFEKKYGISTKDFYTQYKAGKKGDDEDTLI
jgi:hypothetical protein